MSHLKRIESFTGTKIESLALGKTKKSFCGFFSVDLGSKKAIEQRRKEERKRKEKIKCTYVK